MKKILEIFTDGASKGNPGPAGIGVVIYQDGRIIKEISKAIGTQTNNFAEYTAVIYALQEALILKATAVKIHTDSELISNQIKGRYKIKHPDMKRLFDQAQHLAEGFEQLEVIYIKRGRNKAADRLATAVLEPKNFS